MGGGGGSAPESVSTHLYDEQWHVSPLQDDIYIFKGTSPCVLGKRYKNQMMNFK